MFSNVLCEIHRLGGGHGISKKLKLEDNCGCGGWQVVEVTVAVLGSSNTWQASSL
jgi:hypothetical protein